jgi:ubiquitin C-terminal hydrolase
MDDLEFSLSDFGKENKGLQNSGINCFMNVSLQSMIACPAFFNMLTAISESEAYYQSLTENRVVLRKFVELSRHFEPRV